MSKSKCQSSLVYTIIFILGHKYKLGLISGAMPWHNRLKRNVLNIVITVSAKSVSFHAHE